MDFLSACRAPLVNHLDTILHSPLDHPPESASAVANLPCAHIHPDPPVCFVSNTVIYPSPPPTGSEPSRNVPLPTLPTPSSSPTRDRCSPDLGPLSPIMEHEEFPPVPPPHEHVPLSPPPTQPLHARSLPDSSGDRDPIHEPSGVSPIASEGVVSQLQWQMKGAHSSIPRSTGWHTHQTESTLFGPNVNWREHDWEDLPADRPASSILGLRDAVEDRSLPEPSSRRSRQMPLHPSYPDPDEDASLTSSSRQNPPFWGSEDAFPSGPSFFGPNAFSGEPSSEAGASVASGPQSSWQETQTNDIHSLGLLEGPMMVLPPWDGSSLSMASSSPDAPRARLLTRAPPPAVHSQDSNPSVPSERRRPIELDELPHEQIPPRNKATQSFEASLSLPQAAEAGVLAYPSVYLHEPVPVALHSQEPNLQATSEKRPTLKLHAASSVTLHSRSPEQMHIPEADHDQTPGTLPDATHRSPLFYPHDWQPAENASSSALEHMEVDVEHPSPGASSLLSSLSAQSSQSSAFGINTPTDSEFNLFGGPDNVKSWYPPNHRHPTFFFDEDDMDEMLPPPPSPSRRGFLSLEDLEEEPPTAVPGSPSRRSSLPELEMDTDDDADGRSDTPFVPEEPPPGSPRRRFLSLEEESAIPPPSPFSAYCSHMQTPSPPPADLPAASTSSLLLVPGTTISSSPPPDDPLLRELQIPANLDPASELARLCGLRARALAAERAERKIEAQLADRLARLSADILYSKPSLPSAWDPFEAEARRELQAVMTLRAEAKRRRKRAKERGREVGALLSLRLRGECPEGERTVEIVSGGGASKGPTRSVSQLAAKMLFRRRESSARLLANRRSAMDLETEKRNGSSLSRSVSAEDLTQLVADLDIVPDLQLKGLECF
ncbi:hypothetical protein PUNSTDRAFT_144539 [Punctularia strigosozonata HHB-11173 SS5]|uniref:uncharacterized protein n=1 Tax=Punctularia strigosozonata (strain HHB-11173) TaxID=741275 RepID=UPI0004416B36|nr:uncharacterized protein PUNSTDRAFT_144539 [Punctularia strigosozonata HHB-11173 SS5]EIN08116.1 hypothetical protein PUNSTDRAFT_144539 [Punctularia strigosozonata HHB-11173 SS5]